MDADTVDGLVSAILSVQTATKGTPVVLPEALASCRCDDEEQGRGSTGEEGSAADTRFASVEMQPADGDAVNGTLVDGDEASATAGRGSIEAQPEAASSNVGAQPAPEPRQTAASINIKILEPERAGVSNALGFKMQQWLYRVIVDSTLPSLAASGVEVRRQLSEFEVLHKVLRAEYAGCFLPSLPHKALLEADTDDILRGRRQDLQVYLRAIVHHPVLQHSDALRIFLLQPGELACNPAWEILSAGLLAAKRPVSTAEQDGDDLTAAPHHSASSGTSKAALAQIGTWVSRVKQTTVAVFQTRERVLPADETSLRQAKELLQDLERLLELTTRSARTLCTDMDKMASDFHDFGRQMGTLAKYEEAVQGKVGRYTPDGHSSSHRAADCQALAICQAKQSVAWRTLAHKCASTLVTVQDYYLLMPEAIQALEEREAVLENLFQLEDMLADKRQQLEQLQQAPAEAVKGLLRTFSVGAGAMSRQEKRSYQLSQSIAVLENDIKTSRAKYSLIKVRNQTELTRLGLEREADFKVMMAAFAAHQAKLVHASADIWSTLAKRLSADVQMQQ